MNKSVVDRKFGREAFGGDPDAYHAARPAYPDWVFDTLSERGCLIQDTSTFEIGSGTGIATRRLLEFGANPLIAIEPDRRLATFLRNALSNEELNVIPQTFEEIELPENSFDLGFCATAFHWLDEDEALAKIARLVKPGGWWATVWNVFGNPGHADPFHEATKELLQGPSSPAENTDHIPFGLDTLSRCAAIERTAAFCNIEYRSSEWTLVLDPDQIVALYSTYSNINIRQDKEAVLAELRLIARDQFNSKVTRNMVTCLYLAQRNFDHFS